MSSGVGAQPCAHRAVTGYPDGGRPGESGARPQRGSVV